MNLVVNRLLLVPYSLENTRLFCSGNFKTLDILQLLLYLIDLLASLGDQHFQACDFHFQLISGSLFLRAKRVFRISGWWYLRLPKPTEGHATNLVSTHVVQTPRFVKALPFPKPKVSRFLSLLPLPSICILLRSWLQCLWKRHKLEHLIERC